MKELVALESISTLMIKRRAMMIKQAYCCGLAKCFFVHDGIQWRDVCCVELFYDLDWAAKGGLA